MRYISKVADAIAEFVSEQDQSQNLLKIPLEKLELEPNSKQLKEEIKRIKEALDMIKIILADNEHLILEIDFKEYGKK